MSTNYLAVVSCTHCGEMIIAKRDGSIFCACTTKRSCKHPEGMGDCHECTIARLQERVDEAEREAKGLRKALKKPGWENHLEMRRYKALAERRKKAWQRVDLAVRTGVDPATAEGPPENAAFFTKDELIAYIGWEARAAIEEGTDAR